jgi:hypothetical protein
MSGSPETTRIQPRKWVSAAALRRRVIPAILAVIYSYVVIWSHDYVQEPALFMQGKIGMFYWHFGILTVMVIVTIGLVMLIRRSGWTISAVSDSRYAVLAILIAASAAGGFLMVNSVEHVHYLQYAALVLLLTPVFGSAYPALILAVLVGVYDEWYQYYVLHGWQAYLDFNDIILNTIGAVLGGLLVRMHRRTAPQRDNRMRWSFVWVGVFLLTFILFGIGVFGTWVDTGTFVLYKYPRPETIEFAARWIDTGWGNHWFKLEYWEAAVIIFVLPGILLLPDHTPGVLPSSEAHETV